MRNPTYLVQSRHGVFYFRWPLPASRHPDKRRSDVRLSLGTRQPPVALMLARALAVGGLRLDTGRPKAMRYDEMRRHVLDHFQTRLDNLREQIAAHGPPDEYTQAAMRNSRSIADEAPGDFLGTGAQAEQDALLASLLARWQRTETLSDAQKVLLLGEINSGFKAYLDSAFELIADDDGYKYSGAVPALQSTPPEVRPATATSVSFDEVIANYINEGRRGTGWVPKTIEEKQAAMTLLKELTGGMAPASMTKADARGVKDTLLRLPKNRNKMAATRDLNLQDALALEGVEKITTQTVNGYLANYKALFNYAVNNGYAKENIFANLTVPQSKRRSATSRKAFSPEQLRLLFSELTAPASEIASKPHLRWASLIGLFTGARVNEVAQLHLSDIRKVDGIWCFDLNEKMGKQLKTDAAMRIVPIHDKLLATGFLDFVELRRAGVSDRLFPEFTYTPQNGYGRNLGRWFNEQLVPKLNMSGSGLVFHSLRHSMVTTLSQADVAEPVIKAIVGHEQAGVTQVHYNKSGFTIPQLKAALDLFSF
jgi:integrase